MINEKVSIIVPVYNVEKYLDECIQSITKQTYTNIEIILVDDGSKDNSGVICDKYAELDNRISVFHIENGGVSNARNFGVGKAKGQWIQFVDSDDILINDATQILLENSENVDVVVCSYKTFPLERDFKYLPYKQIFSSMQDTIRLFPTLYKNGFYNSPCNKLYRKEKIKQGFDKTLSLGEDLLFNLDFMKDCQGIAVIPNVLYKYRIVSNNTLARKPRKDGLELQCLLKEAVDKAFYFESGVCDCTAEIMFRTIIVMLRSIVLSKSFIKQEKLEIINSWITDKRLEKGLELTNSNGGKKEKILARLIKKRRIKLIYYCFLIENTLYKRNA